MCREASPDQASPPARQEGERLARGRTWNPKQMVGMALNTAIQVEGLGRERGTGQSRGHLGTGS